jgi:hypothetical protein
VFHFGEMVRTELYRFETPAYTYAEGETALARAVGVGLVHQRGALRARLKHFQKLNLVDLEKGKKRVRYSRAQIAQWLIALVLAELGLDPTLIVTTLKNNWRNIASTIELVTNHEAQSGQPYYLCLWSDVMSAPWARKSAISLAVIQLQQPTPFVPAANEMLRLVAENRDKWFCTYNLTRVFSRLENALPSRT